MAVSRSQFLKMCVARLVAAHEDYVQSRDDAIGPKHAFWLAAEALIKAVDDPHSDIPADCRRLFEAVWGNGENTGFKSAWNRWARKEEIRQDPKWKPSAAVWSEFRNLREKMKADTEVVERMVPTVAELVRQGLDDNQIATNYEKYTRTGGVDVGWVHKMKEHPELNTDETRMLGKRKKEMSRQEWQAFAEKLAATPRIQQVLQMLEAGEDVEREQHSRFASEFSLSEFEERKPYEELPSEWGQESPQEYEPQYESHTDTQGGISVEQRAVMLLDDHVDDSEITRQLHISGQKLGSIKRNADRIRETMRELEPVG